MSFKNTKYLVPVLAFGTAFSTISLGAVDNSREEEKLHTFNLSLTSSLSHTDNRDQVGDDGTKAGNKHVEKQGNTIFQIGPNLKYAYSRSQVMKFTANYVPMLTWESDPEDGDESTELRHLFNTGITYAPNTRTLLRLTESYTWQDAAGRYYGADYSFNPDNSPALSEDYYVNNVGALIRYNFSQRFYTDLTGYSRIKRYSEEKIADYSDEDEFGGRLALMNKRSEYFEFGLYAGYESWEQETKAYEVNGYSFDVGYDAFTVGVQATIDFTGAGDHLINASTGYQKLQYAASNMDDQDCWGDSHIELRLFQTRPTKYALGFRYGLDSGDVYPFSSQEDLAGYVSIRHTMLNESLILSGSAEYRLRNYNAEDDLDPDARNYGYVEALKSKNNGKADFERTSIYLRASAMYKFSDSTSASVWYSFQDVDSDVSTDYTENIVGISGTFKFF